MPEWVHNRAAHIRAKNPSMPESESWAIATKQYKEKSASIFRAIAPAITQDQDDRMRQIIREELQAHTAPVSPPKQPSLKSKVASPLPLALIGGFSDQLQRIKLANLSMNSVATKPTVSSGITASVPRNTMSAKMPSYSKLNQPTPAEPSQMHQSVLNPPPVRG